MTDEPNQITEPELPADFGESRLEQTIHDPLGFHGVAEAEQLAVKEREFLDAEHDQMIEEIGKDLHEHGNLIADGVDLSAFKQADPGFDPESFIDIARECFNHIRDARTEGNSKIASGTLSDQLRAGLDAALDADHAARKYHLLPGLEIETAVITSAIVNAGKMTAVVRFNLRGEEMDRNAQLQIVAGSDALTSWEEDWTFWRDPSVDTSASDKDHILSREQDGGWMFAHKGWIVTALTRVGAPDPLDPTNI